MKPYTWSLEREVLLAMFQFSSRDNRRTVDAAEFLARHPFQPGHLNYRDGDDREIRVYFADHLAIHYCIEHAVREVRIVSIQENLPIVP
ncbi:MAG: hypothetical protein EXS37_19130 [Opitutus sp.]|nr:hypothetical protein [Opitutus sp.]